MKKNILVVDDEEAICNLLTAYLKAKGYHVAAAGTAKEALRLVDEVPFHLVVLDVVLADADGLEVLSRLKLAHPNLQVIMLTGIGYQEELLEEARQKGASGWVSKALPIDQLISEIHRVLKNI
jgi:DNA-binding NtrC family response regulator